MENVRMLLADLARQRDDLQAMEKDRKQRGEDLTDVLGRLADLRARMEKLAASSGVREGGAT